MKVLVALFLISIWYLLSFTILLPVLFLLYINKTCRNKWFSFYYSNVIIPIVGPLHRPSRKRAFQLLEEHLSENRKSTPLKILEIGIGGGTNLEFYPENSNLTALDMNASFEKYFSVNKKKFPQVNHERTVINMAENMTDVADSCFDVVVSTFVLCSVLSVESVLKEVKRVLKPGGKFLFVEHVSFPKNDLKYFPQKFASPLWKIYNNGCCLDRNTRSKIETTGFGKVQCEEIFMPQVLLLIRPRIVGIATK